MKELEDKNGLETLVEYLRTGRGIDLTGYKRPSLARRTTKRVRAVGLQSFADYQDYLEVHPEEFDNLFNTILINVTTFFRDPASWEYLGAEILPKIVTAKAADGPIRVWSAGCAAGQEAYTLAMVLAELLGTEAFHKGVRIYATDVDEDALAQARQGSYTEHDLESVPPKLRDKYFQRVAARYVFRNELRRSIVFGRLDLTRDAPISRVDLLVCRNTLMYFNVEAQREILWRFHFALNDPGYLFLGRAEMLLTHANVFTPVNLKHRVFMKASKINLRDTLMLLAHAGDEAPNRAPQEFGLHELAIDSVSAAQVVVDANDTVVAVNQEARSRFGLSPGDVGRPLGELELCYRPVELRPLIKHALAEGRPFSLSSVQRPVPGGETENYEVRVVPLLNNAGRTLGLAITFTDVSRYARLQEALERAHSDLETAYEELQSTNEELQTTNEELQSTIEELETTNEELQSSNEEMETMNEELKSTNDELQAMNEVLRDRTAELNRVNAFLESILASMQGGVIVVDSNLTIQRWSRRAKDLWGLQSEEVQGQSLLDLEIGLSVEQLEAPLRECLAGDGTHQRVVLDARDRRGRDIRCAVTCIPLPAVNDRVPGAILVMEESE